LIKKILIYPQKGFPKLWPMMVAILDDVLMYRSEEDQHYIKQ